MSTWLTSMETTEWPLYMEHMSNNNRTKDNLDDLVIQNFMYLSAAVRGMSGLLAISSNLLTVLAIAYYEYLQTCTNYLVAVLAVADMIGGFSCIFHVLNAFIPMTRDTWLAMCATESTISLSSAGLNVLTIFLISVDRFIFIMFPLRYYTIITTKVTIGSVVVMLVFLLPQLVYLNFFGYASAKMPFCVSVFGDRRKFINQEFYIFASFTLLMYATIGFVAYKQSRAIANEQSLSTYSKSESKITKMLSLVMGMYLLCYIPQTMLLLLHKSGRGTTFYITERIFSWLWWVNSWANPFIYAWKNKAFNRAIRSMLGLKRAAVDPIAM